MKATEQQLAAAIEQAKQQITRAIEEAIAEGIKIEFSFSGAWLGNVHVLRPVSSAKNDYDATIILDLKSGIIRTAINDSNETLQRKKAELQTQIQQIDEELNRRAQK